jgi:histidine triad (HIT) family protein
VLVIPTQHVASLEQISDGALLGEMVLFARELAREAGIAERGYRVVLNTNPDGGQSVYHLHLHVLGGRSLTWPPG